MSTEWLPRRADLQDGSVEPRYRSALEAERSTWWSSGNFDTWKQLYVSEYARGFHVISVLRNHAPSFQLEGADVLDIGCGDAGVIIALAEHGARASGIELNRRSIARGGLRAEEHGVEVNLLAAVAEKLPFGECSQDLVILDNVLEHVGNQDATVAEIRRVLRPGGLLYLVTPKPFALYSLWNDPHYDLAGLVLLPRRLQIYYFERIRGGGAGTYDVGWIPTRWRIMRLLARYDLSTVVPPRELWIDYLRRRIAEPAAIRPGVKRSLAEWLRTRDWPFENRVMRLLWDVSIGSNIILARRS
jgi:2-polyprenyl-3-methyl-5-hydroxy-6-metoxy-1,4-benzoquinol methylase